MYLGGRNHIAPLTVSLPRRALEGAAYIPIVLQKLGKIKKISEVCNTSDQSLPIAAAVENAA